MQSPSQRLFETDIRSVEFRNGVHKKYWDVVALDWPRVILWIRAAPRNGAPDRYHIVLDLDNYRTSAPTGTFWDPETEATLDTSKRPKGRENDGERSRVATVFRTDWKNGLAFYHPYDRMAADSHPGWQADQPRLAWTPDHTIVDYLEVIRSLLNSDDYIGI